MIENLFEKATCPGCGIQVIRGLYAEHRNQCPGWACKTCGQRIRRDGLAAHLETTKHKIALDLEARPGHFRKYGPEYQALAGVWQADQRRIVVIWNLTVPDPAVTYRRLVESEYSRITPEWLDPVVRAVAAAMRESGERYGSDQMRRDKLEPLIWKALDAGGLTPDLIAYCKKHGIEVA